MQVIRVTTMVIRWQETYNDAYGGVINFCAAVPQDELIGYTMPISLPESTTANWENHTFDVSAPS